MDRTQFEQAVRVSQEPLRRFLRHLCRGDEALADDIAQEAFIKAFLHLDTFSGKSTFSTWLFRIAYNCYYDDQRVRSRYIHEDASELKMAAQDHTDAAFAHEDLYLALDLLNLKERTALLLFYMEEMSLKEIAGITRTPVNTVKAHLSRGRTHMNEYLNALGHERR